MLKSPEGAPGTVATTTVTVVVTVVIPPSPSSTFARSVTGPAVRGDRHVAVVAGEEDGRADGSIYLVGAFNSSRPLAWAERTFFRTPYQLADIRLSEQPPVAATVNLAGQVVLSMAMAAATAPSRHEAQAWEGRIYLPPNGAQRELFYAHLAGPTDIYPFTAADTLTLRPRPGDGVLGALVESGFAGVEWRVRAAAVHARSRTYRRYT